MIAGYLTLHFSSPLPDIIVSIFMGILVLKSGIEIIISPEKRESHSHH